VTTPPDSLRFRLAEMTPVERIVAVAALLAAGPFRHLHPAAFPPPAGITNSQEKPTEST
jgi:hypothetical protein